MSSPAQNTDAQALEALFSLRGDERVRDFGLERVHAVLTSLGRPHERLRTLVVAGTNGKGTTALFLTAALREAGHRVATYLSPHLVSLQERFLENGTPIDAATLASLADRVRTEAQKHNLSYFEYATVCFFLWAAERSVDFAVLEVGLGGRLDATNVTDPVATVITNIGLDHTEILGPTHKHVLAEKLGVLRPEALLFTGIEDPELLQQVIHACEQVDAVYYFSKEVRMGRTAIGWEGQTMTLNGLPFPLRHPGPGAAKNAVLAALVLRIAFPKIPVATMAKAFARVRNPGRFETVGRTRNGALRILSGDHNAEGIADLLATLRELPRKPLRVLFGASPDKPFAAMRRQLLDAPGLEELRIVPVPGREEPAEMRATPEFEANFATALDALEDAAGPDEVLLVTGSLYLVGAVRARWEVPVRFLE